MDQAITPEQKHAELQPVASDFILGAALEVWQARNSLDPVDKLNFRYNQTSAESLLLASGDPNAEPPLLGFREVAPRATYTDPKEVNNMLQKYVNPQLPRLALEFALNEFNHIHEPGSEPKEQITFDDLKEYKKTHGGNLVAQYFVDYLLDNNGGATAPKQIIFDLIRNMDPHDAPGNFLGFIGIGSNADGITKSDLESGIAFIDKREADAAAVRQLGDGDYVANTSLRMKDLQELEKAFPTIANGAQTIDAFAINRYANCQCSDTSKNSLQEVARNFDDLARFASATDTMSLPQIKHAEDKIQQSMLLAAAIEKAAKQKQAAALDELKPLLEGVPK
jgi:hypothetical protein